MKSLLSVNPYFYKYRYRLLLGFLFVACSNILLISQGEVIKQATNSFANHFLGKATGETTYLYYAVILIALTIGSGLFMFLKRQFIIVISRLIEFDMKNAIYRHYQKLDVNFYKQNNTGDLMNRISEDVGRVRMYVGPAIMYIMDTLVTVATVVVFMLKESPQLTMLVLLPLPVLSFIIFKVSSLINKRSIAVQEKLSEITGLAQESFSGIRVIKAFNREEWFDTKMDEASADYRNRYLRLVRTEAMFSPFMVLMVGISLVSILYFGGNLYIEGKLQSIGNFPQFVFFVYKLTWPFASLGWVISLIQRAAASQKRIDDFLQTKTAIENRSQETLAPIKQIEFSQVCYTYPNTGIKAIKDISFTLKPGKTLALVGKTGSGKSTVAQLLCRLMDADSGEIRIDGKSVQEVNLSGLRQQIGYVPQDVFLFSDTISGNVGFGLDACNENDIKEACRKAGILDSVMSFPDALQTIIGERGVTLSGGQKQRLSIARAIIKKPEVFIMDDCLSAVDTETETFILNELKQLMTGKTNLIISHRISTVKHADEILVMDEGRIVEQGTHEELLVRRGHYYELNQLQTLESTVHG